VPRQVADDALVEKTMALHAGTRATRSTMGACRTAAGPGSRRA